MATKGGSIKSTSINGVKIYSVSAQRPPPTSFTSKKLRDLRKDKDYQQRVDLIQDLKFETATTKIKVTPDGEYVIASGIYPPQVKVFELKELSMKFERHLVSEIVNYELLSDDYAKIAFLCADRSVCLHAKYGSHYSIRIPRMGRDIKYDCWSCDLLCAASSPDVYRINLEQGRFLASLNTQSPSINVVSRSTVHGLVACGGEDGALECFDMRKRSSVGRVDVTAASGDQDHEVTAIQFDDEHGYLMAVGSSAGKVLVYDLRMSDPVHIKDHMYDSPILDIKWHRTLNSTEAKVISADRHAVRIWDYKTGTNMTSIEPTNGVINDVCTFRGSGLMLLALDCSQIPAYFVPALGPAPKWCSYIENITEEMEEGAETFIYDNYRFLTKEELERLNMSNLIGTNLLTAYMHGFFVDYRLYKKAKALVDPFEFQAYQEKRKQEKIEAERDSRITIKRRLPKVNKNLASRLLEKDETGEPEVQNGDVEAFKKKSSKKNKGLTTEFLKDERFRQLFENEDFEVDELSTEYLALHPHSTQKQPSLIEEHFDPVLEEEHEQSDLEGQYSSQSEDPDVDTMKHKNSKRVRLYEVKDERHAEAFANRISLAKEDALPMGERVASLLDRQPSGVPSGIKVGPGGSREITFVSRSSKKHKSDSRPRDEKRRGIQSLGLKPDKSETYGRGPFRGRGRGAHRGKSRGRGRR